MSCVAHVYGRQASSNVLISMRACADPLRNSAADALASAARNLSPLNTIQWTSISGRWDSNLRIVPPQPISISSEWAPRQSTLFMSSALAAIMCANNYAGDVAAPLICLLVFLFPYRRVSSGGEIPLRMIGTIPSMAVFLWSTCRPDSVFP